MLKPQPLLFYLFLANMRFTERCCGFLPNQLRSGARLTGSNGQGHRLCPCPRSQSIPDLGKLERGLNPLSVKLLLGQKQVKQRSGSRARSISSGGVSTTQQASLVHPLRVSLPSMTCTRQSIRKLWISKEGGPRSPSLDFGPGYCLWKK